MIVCVREKVGGHISACCFLMRERVGAAISTSLSISHAIPPFIILLLHRSPFFAAAALSFFLSLWATCHFKHLGHTRMARDFLFFPPPTCCLLEPHLFLTFPFSLRCCCGGGRGGAAGFHLLSLRGVGGEKNCLLTRLQTLIVEAGWIQSGSPFLCLYRHHYHIMASSIHLSFHLFP